MSDKKTYERKALLGGASAVIEHHYSKDGKVSLKELGKDLQMIGGEKLLKLLREALDAA